MIELGALNAPSEGPLPAVGVFSLQHWQSFATTSDHPTSQSSITETVGLRTIIHDLRLFNRRPFGEGPLNWIMLDANVCQPNTLHLILHETWPRSILLHLAPAPGQESHRTPSAEKPLMAPLTWWYQQLQGCPVKRRRDVLKGISRASMCCVWCFRYIYIYIILYNIYII